MSAFVRDPFCEQSVSSFEPVSEPTVQNEMTTGERKDLLTTTTATAAATNTLLRCRGLRRD